MAERIATMQYLSDTEGFFVLPTDNLKKAVTKAEIEARVASGYVLAEPIPRESNQLVPQSLLKPIWNWSYFRVTLVPPTGVSLSLYACCRSTSVFNGTSIGDYNTFEYNYGQKLNAVSYNPDGTQRDIMLKSGRWSTSPYQSNGGYLYLVMKGSNGNYYLYGEKTISSIIGSSAFGAFDEEDYISTMQPVGTYTLMATPRILTSEVTPD